MNKNNHTLNVGCSAFHSKIQLLGLSAKGFSQNIWYLAPNKEKKKEIINGLVDLCTRIDLTLAAFLSMPNNRKEKESHVLC